MLRTENEIPERSLSSTMFFRFLCCVALVVLISVAGVALEKETLQTRRNISKQHYRMEILRESFAKMRLRVQELGAPEKLIESVEKGTIPIHRPEQPATSTQRKRIPMLHWDSDPTSSAAPSP